MAFIDSIYNECRSIDNSIIRLDHWFSKCGQRTTSSPRA